MKSFPRLIQASATAAMLFLLAAIVVSAQPAPPGDVVVGGLERPRGLTVDGNDVLIAELGAGRILRLAPNGTTEVVVSGLPTGDFVGPEGPDAAGPAAAIAVPGGYVIVVSELPDDAAFQSVYFASTDGNLVKIADLGAYEADNNTDGDSTPDGAADTVSNPFDVVSDGEGGVLVSNAGANAVLRISAEGEISPYAIFPRIDNPLFPDVGGPTMQQVPTGMTVGPDGAVYVSTLTGFPFAPGGARVLRLVDLNGDGDALDSGENTVYASGLTSATDVAFDAGGNLLVTQFSANMLGENVPGQLVRVSGGTVEVVVDGLVTPTGVAVTADGRILVAQEFAALVSDVTDVVNDGGDDDDASDDEDDDQDGTPEPTATATATGTPGAPPPASTGQGPTAGSSLPLALILLTGVAAAGVAGARFLVTDRRSN